MPAPVLIKTTPMSYRVSVTESGFLPQYPFSVNEYVSPFIEMVFNPTIRRWVVDKKYRYYNMNTKELYLPLYDLPRFLNRLKTMEIPYQLQELPLTVGKAVAIDLKPGVAVRDDLQSRAVDYAVNNTAPVRGLALQTGKGKALTLDTPVRIPGGWKPMGEIQVGDKVITWNGDHTDVTAVHPQGVTETYRVTFADGRWLDTSGDHLWTSYFHSTSEGSRWKTRTTLEIKRLLSLYAPQIRIPLNIPEITPNIDLPIDPYVLGYLIGNGGLTRNAVLFSTCDAWVISELEKHLPTTLKITKCGEYEYGIRRTTNSPNIYRKQLTTLGLMGKHAHEKTIPDLYMNGSIEQRWALIQGLMDSDGSASKKGSTSFSTTSTTLANQIQYLIRSLGGIASIGTNEHKYYTYLGVSKLSRPSHQINIRVRTPKRLFRLPRKKEKVLEEHRYAGTLRLRIVSVVQVESQPTQCITIAHGDGLFVAKDFIVTHNSASALMAISQIGRRTMLVLPGMVDQWVRSVEQFTTLKPEDIYIVRGAPSIFKLMAQIDKKLNPKIIICLIGTLRGYCMDKDSFVNCPPFDDLCKMWDVGVRIIDEAHLNFHANLMMDLRLTPAVTIVMTATFDSSRPNIKTIFDNHYPVTMRFGEDEYHSYVDVYSYAYRTGVGDVPTSAYRGMNGYSQIKWEHWLLHKGRHKLRQITEEVYLPLLRSHYALIAEPGEKCLILCDTVDMCKFILNEVSLTFPEFTSTIYVEGTPDNVLETTNIIVSTPRSAGTGRDIKNLLTVLVTTSVRSAPLNEQMLGRLRVLPSGRTPQFIYCWNSGLMSHVSHAIERAAIFRPLAKNFYECTI